MRRTILAAAAIAVLAAGPAAAQDRFGNTQPLATAHQTDFQIGQLATIRGQSARVRQFGQRLMDDHGTALAQLAAAGRVTWPIDIDTRHRLIEQELSTLEGRAFDRRFLEVMIEDHEALASMLGGQGNAAPEVARASSSDAERAVGTSGTIGDSRPAASSARRAVERNLAEARRLQRALGQR